MAIIKKPHSSLLSTMQEAPALVPTPVVEPTPASSEPVIEPVPDIDALLLSPEDKETYGPELIEAMAKLTSYLSVEGVTLAQMRTAFEEVNRILIANPTLATEAMLPHHIEDLCAAAYKLSHISVGVGTQRRAASKEPKAAKEKKETANATKLAARLASLAEKHTSINIAASADDAELDL